MLIYEKNITKIRRKNVILKLLLYKTTHFRYFCFNTVKRIPVNNKNTKTLRFRKKKKSTSSWVYLKTSHPYCSLSIITYIFFSLKLYKFISIISNSSGVVYSKLTTKDHSLWGLFIFQSNLKLWKKQIIKFPWFNELMPFIKREYFLSTIKRLTFVNSIELFFNKGSQYAMATGSKAKILETYKFDRITQVKLPSGKIKIFDMYATCNHSPLLLGTKKKLLFDCKRYYRFRGFGPNVRGVAMNAIDHPHGGKTKSLKYPKTPWGLTTKF